MNKNISEVERLIGRIRMQELWIKELQKMKGNQFTPKVLSWNIDILDEMYKKYEVYIKEEGES